MTSRSRNSRDRARGTPRGPRRRWCASWRQCYSRVTEVARVSSETPAGPVQRATLGATIARGARAMTERSRSPADPRTGRRLGLRRGPQGAAPDRRGRPAAHRLRTCEIEVLRPDDMLEFVAIAGNEERRRRDAAPGDALLGHGADARPRRGVRRVDLRRPGVAHARGGRAADGVLLDPRDRGHRAPRTSGAPWTSSSPASSTTGGSCGP